MILYSTNNAINPVELEQRHPNKLIESGIMAYVRHPLYLGILLVYLGSAVVTISISSFVKWVVIFAIYNRMASFEEKQLEIMFGEAYSEYKKLVPKWIGYDLFSVFMSK